MHIEIDDAPSANIDKYFESAYSFIDKKLRAGNVLVHCRKGISRSATIVIAYLMAKYGIDLKEVLAFIRRRTIK